MFSTTKYVEVSLSWQWSLLILMLPVATQCSSWSDQGHYVIVTMRLQSHLLGQLIGNYTERFLLDNERADRFRFRKLDYHSHICEPGQTLPVMIQGLYLAMSRFHPILNQLFQLHHGLHEDRITTGIVRVIMSHETAERQLAKLFQMMGSNHPLPRNRRLSLTEFDRRAVANALNVKDGSLYRNLILFKSYRQLLQGIYVNFVNLLPDSM